MEFHLHGVLSPDWLDPSTPNSGIVSEEIDVGDGRLLVGFGEPVSGSVDPSDNVFGFYKAGPGGPDIPVTFTQKVLGDGSIEIDSTFAVETSLGNTFASDISLRVNWAGEGILLAPSTVKILDTGTFDIISNDPNVAWTSDGGRSSIPESSTPVPEPRTLALLALAFAGIGVVRGRKLN